MRRIILTSFIFLVTACGYTVKAQVIEQKNNLVKKEEQKEAKAGTYQFIYYPSKLKYFFTNETLKEIERKREEKKDVYIWLTPTVQVKILSKEYIESPEFIPLPEKKYVDE
ncbi:hypothetical protein ACQ33O_02625 [Ferruginibacter sp. SUN002]|uniref:hypothetical protein n=1 Tax=Ferruginibacter sp. SUN002 TaxID=2937789 RepID=UPI003D360A63